MLNHLHFTRTIAAALFACMLPGSAPAAIDLTPRYIDVFAEGVTFHRLYFTDGDKKFLVSLNHETEVSAESGGVLFRFPKYPDITFVMARSRLSPDDKFEGATLDRYRESARRLLPLKARASEIKEEVTNPFPINDWKSYRIVMTAEMGPVHYMQSVTFLNLNDTDQIVLITGAPERDFEEASVRSFRIVRTWQEMLPGDEKPIRTN